MATTGDRVQDNSSEVETNGGKAATPVLQQGRRPRPLSPPRQLAAQTLVTAAECDASGKYARDGGFRRETPRPTALRVLLSLFAYALLVSDVPRAGSSVDSLPFVQIEPNVFTVYGPTALPRRTIFRNGSTITNEESTISSEVFSMLDTLVEALAANAPSTTSYKNVAQTDNGIAITARGELSSLPNASASQRGLKLAGQRDAMWETVSSRAAALQKTLSKSEKLDVTLIEAESDPLTRLGGAVLLAHKIYNVVVLYRIRECTDAGVCTTTTIFDERVEGKVLYTDALEWSSLASTLRFIGQLYVIVRVVCLFVACYAVGSAFAIAANTDTSRLKRTLRVFFAVPSQVVVYGSWLPVLCYASAHIIDALILYELEDDGGESTTDSFAALTHLSGGVDSITRSFRSPWSSPPALALGAVAFVAHGGIAVDDHLDAWKMNLEGVYSDMLAVALAAIIYVVVILAARALMRWHRRVPDPLFFARSAVPSAAGALWEPSCLSVSWDDDLLGPLLTMLSATTPGISQRNIDKKQGSSQENTDDNVAANGNEMATSSASTAQRMLMNLVFLSDPWNLLVLKLGRARVHLYHLRGSGLDCKVVHANAKARVAREYSLALENVELVASLRASELSWSQLVTCK
ncbi:hypothetical protein GQ600_21323 [Phytophthora cactorum]|nr:hypothetical protein GQ600_21323 [Phytophthora cactorum]